MAKKVKDATKVKMGKTNRRKGHQFERDIVNLLGEGAKRVLEYQEGLGFDVEYGRLRIQCKRGKSYAPINRIEEVYEGMKKSNNKDITMAVPVLITKADKKRAIVAMYLDDFLKIYEGYEICSNSGVLVSEEPVC